MEKTIKYEIYIGYNDAQTREAFVSEEELVGLVTSFFQARDIGVSIMHAKGGYLYESGGYVLEHTMVITLVGDQNLDIMMLSRALSMYMNQECLMITKTISEMNYR